MLLKMLMFSLALLAVGCGSPSDSDHKFVPERPVIVPDDSTDIAMIIRDFADVIRTQDTGQDPLLNDPALTSVTREYGPTVITTKQFPFRSEVAQTTTKPWSSWWFPKKEIFLFDDSQGKNSSALSKYDLYRKKRYDAHGGGPKPGSAADYERSHYSSDSLSWEGLCDAWSIASISKPEPKRPVTVSIGGTKITFKVSELKALLLKTYEAAEDVGLKYYGQKFTGDVNGWIYPDIFPEQFHRFLEVQLFQARKPFIMDHDPGIQVWNVPVFKANFIMDSVPNDPNAVFVRTWVYSAESTLTTEKDFVGTREGIREYDYVLQGSRSPNGDLTVKSGYWVRGPDGADSRKDHPDYLIQIPDPEKLVRKSWNPEIDVGIVDEIVNQAY